MNTNLEIIWILDKTGLCYIQRIFDRSTISMDETRFSGLITSIMMFSKDIFEENFEKLTMGGREIFIKPFTSVIVALAAKRDAKGRNDKDIFNLIDEIGQAFQVEYAEFLKSKALIDVSLFEKFGAIIDQICGLETFIYLDEHDQLIDILKNAEVNGLDESATVKDLLHFLDDLNDYKLEIILDTAGDVLEPFFSSKNGLTPSQKKRYGKIFH